MINCGIIGLGRSGYKIHFKSLSQNKQFNIVALCDSDKKKLRKFNKKNILKTTNYTDLINLKKIDLIIISTNTSSLYEISKYFIANKKSVVIEKPLVKNIYQYRALSKLAKKNKTKIFPFFNFRFSHDYNIIKKTISSKIIGDIHHIIRNESYYNIRDDWQSLKKNQGGIINSAAIHQIDQVLNIIDSDIKKYNCYSRNIINKGDADDFYKSSIIFKNNIIADIISSWASSDNMPKWIINGNLGSISATKSLISIKYYNKKKITNIKRKPFSYLSNNKIIWKEKKIKYKSDEKHNYSANIYYNKLRSIFYSKNNFLISDKSVLKTLDLVFSNDNL